MSVLRREMLIERISLYVLFLFLFLAGLGYARNLVIALGGVVSVLFLIYSYASKKELSFPKGFLAYNLFLIFFLLSLVWSLDWQKSFLYLVLFVSGGIFWLAFYNLQNELKRSIENIVLVLGILFGILALSYKYFAFAPLGKAYFSLVFPATVNHHHIGDFWAIVLTLVIYKVFVQKRYLYSLFFIPGIYFLLISLSRAAYLSLGVGAFVIFSYQGWLAKYKKYMFLIFFLMAALFLFAGAQKPTLFSRPYFLQAAVGLLKYPLGVGVGNFGSLSTEAFAFFGNKLAAYSFVTHNIVLEVLVGMGILGLSFVYWLYLVFKDLLGKSKENNLVLVASFFTIFANFFFDFTYVIPTMFWLFFLFLGIAQKEESRSF